MHYKNFSALRTPYSKANFRKSTHTNNKMVIENANPGMQTELGDTSNTAVWTPWVCTGHGCVNYTTTEPGILHLQGRPRWEGQKGKQLFFSNDPCCTVNSLRSTNIQFTQTNHFLVLLRLSVYVELVSVL